MSGRTGQLSPAQQRELGRAVRTARGNGVPWKALERVYGRSRRHLMRLARQDGATFPCCETDVASAPLPGARGDRQA